MDAMGKLRGIVYILAAAKKDMASLRNVYGDYRGNLEDAENLIADALLNIEGHLDDIKKGVE